MTYYQNIPLESKVLTKNINHLPRYEQNMNIEDDTDDNKTVDDDDKEHANKNVGPVICSLLDQVSYNGTKNPEVLYCKCKGTAVGR